MITRRASGNGDKVRITFIAPEDAGDGPVNLVGDFTGWQRVPMKRQRDGKWKTTVELDPGRDYEFRYVAGGEEWLNDPEADGYRPSPFGTDNCVVVT